MPTLDRLLQGLRDQDISESEFLGWLLEHLNEHPERLIETMAAIAPRETLHQRCVDFLKELKPSTELLRCGYPTPTSIRPAEGLLKAVAEHL